MNPERFHLVLTAAGRPVAHGWWADEETGETLASWPDPVVSGPR